MLLNIQVLTSNLYKKLLRDLLYFFLTNEFHQSFIFDFSFHYTSQQFKLEKQLKYKEYLRLISGYSMVTAEGAMSLLDITEHLEKNNIKGVFIEMGCWKGGMSALMAMNSSNRDIWLFDSFEGIPNLRQEDFDGIFEFAMKTKLNSGELKPLGRLEASIDDARYAMQNIAKHKLEKTHYVKGWFQDTLPKYASEIKDIALLRLDGDLYDNYIVSLDTLWDKVVPGGFIIIDDWALGGCRKAINDFLKKEIFTHIYIMLTLR